MESICPLCQTKNTKFLISRKNVPVHQNLPLESVKDAESVTRGDLDLFICNECGFVYNTSYDSDKMSYSPNYNNNQLYSTSFQKYVDEIVNYLIGDHKLTDCNILEVGCGKGYFIEQIISKGNGNKGIGFDPSYAGSDTLYDGNLIFIKDFFDTKYKNIQADVVICRHVIEHIDNPVAFLSNLKESLINSNGVKIFFETPCVEWIFENNVFWDLFYEHCSYFSKKSLTKAFEVAGFKVDSVKHIFNGQYLWLEASLSNGNNEETKIETNNNHNSLVSLAERYIKNEQKLMEEWKHKISSCKSVAVWGAGAKGVTFVNLLDPQKNYVKCVIDLNPYKQGKYIPATGHPIVDYGKLEQNNISSIVIMNPNYKEEIQILLSKLKQEYELLEMEL